MIDEKGNLGGNCLFEGCVPSKAVREAAALAVKIRGAEYFGLDAEIELPHWDRIRSYKDRIQTYRYAQHRNEIEETALLTMVRGVGRFVSDHEIAVEDWDRETTDVVTGHDIIIATGSEVRSLSIPGAEYLWHSHHLFAWHEAVREMPLDIVILGGGYIGVETASMLSALGLHVTLLEMAPSILPGMDQDLVKVMAGHMTQRGVRIETGVRVLGRKTSLNQQNLGLLDTGETYLSTSPGTPYTPAPSSGACRASHSHERACTAKARSMRWINSKRWTFPVGLSASSASISW
jgi:dihydrolipoamide dehydrogenase